MNKLFLSALRVIARHPLLAVAAVPCAAAAVAVTVAHGSPASPVDVAGEDPRAVLGQVWFDKYPEKSTDVVEIWLWFGGGIGLHERGSRWRGSMDFFEFERQSDKLSMVLLQDKKEISRRFTITKCSEAPPFDLCLDLDERLGGKKRYYGFAYDDDMNARIPWARRVAKAAEERAAGGRD